jgi:hypothetical protein
MSFSNNTTGATSRPGTANCSCRLEITLRVSSPWFTSSTRSVITKRHEQLAVPGLLVAPVVLLLN